jgi:hypothetical protein
VNRNFEPTVKAFFLCAALALALPAASLGKAKADPLQRLKTVGDALYVNVASLENTFQDLQQMADDESLDVESRCCVQVAAEAVFAARAIAYLQYSQVSGFAFIRSDARGPWCSLRQKELQQAVADSKSRIDTILYWLPGIKTPDVEEVIEQGLRLIQANIYMFETLSDLMPSVGQTTTAPLIPEGLRQQLEKLRDGMQQFFEKLLR